MQFSSLDLVSTSVDPALIHAAVSEEKQVGLKVFHQLAYFVIIGEIWANPLMEKTNDAKFH